VNWSNVEWTNFPKVWHDSQWLEPGFS